MQRRSKCTAKRSLELVAVTGASLAQLPLGKEVDPPLRLLGLVAFWQLQGISSDCSCACLGGAKSGMAVSGAGWPWSLLVLRSFQALCPVDTAGFVLLSSLWI